MKWHDVPRVHLPSAKKRHGMFFLSLSRGALLELDPLESLEEERPRLLPPFEVPLDLPLPFFGLAALLLPPPPPDG